MPELPEVETIKEALRRATEGAKIESAAVYNKRLRISVPDDFEKRIRGAFIMRLYRIAKYALMELDNGYTIVWHFGMSGKIKITDTPPPKLEKHDHVIINTSKGTLVYNDPRRFGVVTLIKTKELKENPLFNKLGLDPFDENLTNVYLKNKLEKKRIPIKIALLDQGIISGIGNIYASEALYEAQISPLRESSSLNLYEVQKLISAVQSVLRKAIAAGGSTLHDYRQPDGSTGYFQLQHCVYGKDGNRCPNCVCKNNYIQKIVQGSRSTYYCPHLQK